MSADLGVKIQLGLEELEIPDEVFSTVEAGAALLTQEALSYWLLPRRRNTSPPT